jgi:hypothetical protein
VRLGLVAAKPTDAVTYGLLPAAARLGLEVFLLTDQPDGHAGALARARPDLGRAGQGVQPRIVGCDVHDARALVGWGVRLEHLTSRVRNASTPAFHYLA